MQSLRSWWSDRLLRNVLTNSSYLFSSNAATIVLGMVQGILAARTLGAENFGILSATVIPFVSMVSRLTSFRMSELVVKYMGQYMAEEKKDQAAAVAKAAVVADSLVSLLGFALLLLIAPLAAIYLAKDPQTAPLFTFYGIILLGNATFETATGVLQATNRFRTIALVNFGQSSHHGVPDPRRKPDRGWDQRGLDRVPGGQDVRRDHPFGYRVHPTRTFP